MTTMTMSVRLVMNKVRLVLLHLMEVAELLVIPQGSTMATMTVSITAQISVAEETLVVVETLVTVGSSPRFIVGFQHASQA